MAELERYKKELAPYVGDTSSYLYETVVKGGKTALLEGQLGTMKDPDHGIYPMVTSSKLRKRGGDGGEYGATTGRPRRVGFYDTVASRYGVRLQGGTEVALTVLDCLSYLDEIPVCVGYELDGKVIKDFPTTTRLKRCKPVWTKLPGWKTDIRGIRKYEDLPENARKYVEFIEKELGVHISMVSNGPAREDIIYR